MPDVCGTVVAVRKAIAIPCLPPDCPVRESVDDGWTVRSMNPAVPVPHGVLWRGPRLVEEGVKGRTIVAVEEVCDLLRVSIEGTVIDNVAW